MQRISTYSLSVIAGIVATLGALWILVSDAVASNHWSLEHILMPPIVLITVVSGHLTAKALKDLKLLSALGFVVLFLMGTGLSVYSSVGRQTESAAQRVKEQEANNTLIADKQLDLTKARKRYEEAQTYADRERGTSCGRRCQDWELRAKEVKAHVDQLEAEIASLGPTHAIDAKANRTAQLLSLATGLPTEQIKALVLMLEPFAYSLFLELTAIVCFGYGFSASHRKPKQSRDNPKPETEISGQSHPVSIVEPGEIIPWIHWFRKSHARAPMIREVHQKFPEVSRSTCWRRIKDANHTPNGLHSSMH